jgi:hypothetical protein
MKKRCAAGQAESHRFERKTMSDLTRRWRILELIDRANREHCWLEAQERIWLAIREQRSRRRDATYGEMMYAGELADLGAKVLGVPRESLEALAIEVVFGNREQAALDELEAFFEERARRQGTAARPSREDDRRIALEPPRTASAHGVSVRRAWR